MKTIWYIWHFYVSPAVKGIDLDSQKGHLIRAEKVAYDKKEHSA